MNKNKKKRFRFNGRFFAMRIEDGREMDEAWRPEWPKTKHDPAAIFAIISSGRSFLSLFVCLFFFLLLVCLPRNLFFFFRREIAKKTKKAKKIIKMNTKTDRKMDDKGKDETPTAQKFVKSFRFATATGGGILERRPRRRAPEWACPRECVSVCVCVCVCVCV